LPVWKPASVFAHYVCIIIAFAIGEIHTLVLLGVQNSLPQVCKTLLETSEKVSVKKSALKSQR